MSTTSTPPLLCRPLGLFGWDRLEPLVLAALVAESPMLLIGSHGSAKSFLLERLAQALRLEYRFYNASQINYDDIAGIPVPTPDGQSLRYLQTPNSIWEAQVVFVDELNRTRPDLQNKLFPIIHEKRMQGHPLQRLVHRWAAMNPPPQPDADDADAMYLGAEPLDPALADRFPFIIPVPDWTQLDDAARIAILEDCLEGRHEFPGDPLALVEDGRRRLAELARSAPKALADYLIALSSLLGKAGIHLSTRRMTMLLSNILAVHAARNALWHAAVTPQGSEPEWKDSAYLGVCYGLPSRTTGPVNEAAIFSVHKQAWRITGLHRDDPWRRVLTETDPAARIGLACTTCRHMPAHEVGIAILDALPSVTPEERRTALSLALHLRLADWPGGMPLTVIETLSQPLAPILDAQCIGKSASKRAEATAEAVRKALEQDAPPSTPNGQLRMHYEQMLLDGIDFNKMKPAEVLACFRGFWTNLNLDQLDHAP